MARLLIVDDERDIRQLYAEELADDGYEVATAADSATALELLQSREFDAVILDIHLDQESGLELLQKIVRGYRQLPVILCSAYSSYRDDFSSWQAAAYVVKSSNLDELKAQVRQVLARQPRG